MAELTDRQIAISRHMDAMVQLEAERPDKCRGCESFTLRALERANLISEGSLTLEEAKAETAKELSTCDGSRANDALFDAPVLCSLDSKETNERGML